MIVDVSGVESISSLHNILKEKLSFPEYYGANLDALHDVLCENSSFDTVTFVGFDKMQEAIGDYANILVNVFEDAGVKVSK